MFFNNMCEQLHVNLFNPFLKSQENGDFNGTCKYTLPLHIPNMPLTLRETLILVLKKTSSCLFHHATYRANSWQTE